MRKPRLLWIGDAVIASGFARVTHCVLEHLREHYDVEVLGINYGGDPHPYPYPIYVAQNGGDMWGLKRYVERVEAFRPDFVIMNNDAPILAQLGKLHHTMKLTVRGLKKPKLFGYMPVDGPGIHRDVAVALNRLDAVIYYTEFGLRVVKSSGHTGAGFVIPHGVDQSIYRPLDRTLSRRSLGIDPDAWIVGNVNRNQPRKRIDLTLARFGEWVRTRELPPSVKLLLHMSTTDVGWTRLADIAAWFGIGKERLVLTQPNAWHVGIPEKRMPMVYSSCNVILSTALGEGWGLPILEAMACGVPPIVPEWSALAEWAPPGAWMVPCDDTAVVNGLNNTIGGVIAAEPLFAALDELYHVPATHDRQRLAALACASLPQYRWEAVAAEFHRVLEAVGGEEEEEPWQAESA